MRYVLHPEAAEDLREAAGFYREEAGEGVSRSFLAEVEGSIERLLEHPGLGPRWRHGKRRLVLRRFPYSLLYAVTSEEIRIFAVAHHSRRQTYWRGRK